jgi:hypothetical protein
MKRMLIAFAVVVFAFFALAQEDFNVGEVTFGLA